MSYLIIYLIKSSLSLAVLYLSYELFFRKEAYFRFSRYFLLATLFIVIVLPLIPYNAAPLISNSSIPLHEVVIYSQLAQVTLDEVVINAGKHPQNLIGGISIGTLLLLVYFSGVLVKFMHFLFRLIQIRALIKRSETLRSDGLRFVFTEKGSPTYSFMNWIFIDRDLINKEDGLPGIIAHEKIHARQGHSYDLIIAEILTIIQWFNPFAYLLQKIIKENHEYLSDYEVVTNYHDIKAYQLLLLDHSSAIKTNILTHNFSYSLLKRRLNMINKSKRPLRIGVGLVGAIVAFGFVLFACSTPVEEAQQNNNELSETVTAKDVYTVVEVMPEYPGGMDSLAAFLGRTIKYPESAKENGIAGTVFVNFIVDKDGTVGNAKVIRGISDDCDNEAIRVINSMPDWTPGMQKGKSVKVSFNLPIKFKLENSKNKITRIRIIDDIDKDSVYNVVEQMPEYPGGIDALMKYLGSNIKYPEQAKKDAIQGRVFVSFVVEKSGDVSNVELLRGIGGGCDEEAIRVVSSMPSWKAGKDESGKAVRVKYNLPIKFALD